MGRKRCRRNEALCITGGLGMERLIIRPSSHGGTTASQSGRQHARSGERVISEKLVALCSAGSHWRQVGYSGRGALFVSGSRYCDHARRVLVGALGASVRR